MFRKLIKDEISKIVPAETNFSVEVPEVYEHGDYSSNVAMVLGKKEGKNPREMAEELALRLRSGQLSRFCEKVEIAGSGFLNFFIAPKALIFSLKSRIPKRSFFEKLFSKKKKVIVEYAQPNPFKLFHIGHLMNITIGEALARINEAVDCRVIRANYQGDVGIHVAKAVWGIKEMKKLSLAEGQTLKEKMNFLSLAYVEGNRAYETDEKAKKEIVEINEQIYKKNDPVINEIYKTGKKLSLEYFEEIYKKVGTKFDAYFFESEVGQEGLNIVRKHPEVFEKGDGAVVFHGEKYGMHARVFINSNGFPTYEAKELGLNKKKFEIYKPDLSIVLAANEVNDYFKVVLKAMSMVLLEVAQKTRHISYGMIRLAGGKMSSRTGDVITADWLLDEAEKMALEKIKTNQNISKEKQNDIAKSVALGAVKYSILKHSIGSDIIFDPEKSVSFEGHTGPYIQYTYARFRSILRKFGKSITWRPAYRQGRSDRQVEIDAVEKQIILAISRFDEVLEDALGDYMPNILAHFIFSLAQKANEFYHSHPVLQEADQSKKELRLALISKISETLKKGLYILGIDAPDEM